MKFTILLLFGLTVFISSTWADNYELAAIAPTGIMDDFLGWIKNAAKGTSSAFLKVMSSIVNKIMSIISKWKGSNFEVVIRLGSQIMKLKDLADDYLIMLGDQIHGILDKFEGSINSVLDILNIKFDEAMDKANHTLFNATTQLQDWRDYLELRLKTEAPHRYDEGMKIVEEFSNKSIVDVYSCSEGAIKPIRNLFDKCETLVNETLPLARALVDSVQKCIFDGGWDISRIQSCLIKTKDVFLVTIKEFPSKISALQSEIYKLLIEELFNLPCIAGSRIKIEIGKKEITQRIDDMIKQSKSNMLLYLLH
ncbi:uncharacterized protein LOC129616399 [Condylostylus longicornis]|uniref:uncharacterized protein LOC129616399 n=1 Tax=Condylostylus longicornis TaxID=2530218 RepID=UPI00244DDC9C|nr:uncharacterized protein LOC129616399 [Condylostylus longicornis]